MELMPSESTPPLIRSMYTGPSTGSPEISEVAVMSPMASSAVTTKMTVRGMQRYQSNASPTCRMRGRAIHSSGRVGRVTRPIRKATA